MIDSIKMFGNFLALSLLFAYGVVMADGVKEVIEKDFQEETKDVWKDMNEDYMIKPCKKKSK